MSTDSASQREFLVVVNDEEQYSVWFADRDLPLGWRAEGTRGTREECLAHIDRVWTDMRPRSVREHLAAHSG
ncbi:MbtH family protein [Saccharothrix syringae]|uniref:MbtH family protein n=1 Tax=Saccharothrix syringae TaxID=103733 RepID=A0A5Q0H118_SACSY|nr:MbtH family protein [Saccharothrix syringae]QFZ19888.1 MbtH family protein [Saccharothrix syringae]